MGTLGLVNHRVPGRTLGGGMILEIWCTLAQKQHTPVGARRCRWRVERVSFAALFASSNTCIATDILYQCSIPLILMRNDQDTPHVYMNSESLAESSTQVCKKYSWNRESAVSSGWKVVSKWRPCLAATMLRGSLGSLRSSLPLEERCSASLART